MNSPTGGTRTGEVKKDRKVIFVIAIILTLVVFYIIDMSILAWRL